MVHVAPVSNERVTGSLALRPLRMSGGAEEETVTDRWLCTRSSACRSTADTPDQGRNSCVWW